LTEPLQPSSLLVERTGGWINTLAHEIRWLSSSKSSKVAWNQLPAGTVHVKTAAGAQPEVYLKLSGSQTLLLLHGETADLARLKHGKSGYHLAATWCCPHRRQPSFQHSFLPAPNLFPTGLPMT
jgi:hypothetical protein